MLLHAGADLTVTDTSVTSVLHQSLFLNFLPRKKFNAMRACLTAKNPGK